MPRTIEEINTEIAQCTTDIAALREEKFNTENSINVGDIYVSGKSEFKLTRVKFDNAKDEHIIIGKLTNSSQKIPHSEFKVAWRLKP